MECVIQRVQDDVTSIPIVMTPDHPCKQLMYISFPPYHNMHSYSTRMYGKPNGKERDTCRGQGGVSRWVSGSPLPKGLLTIYQRQPNPTTIPPNSLPEGRSPSLPAVSSVQPPSPCVPPALSPQLLLQGITKPSKAMDWQSKTDK